MYLHAVQSVAWSLAANVTQCLSSSNLMTCRGEKRKDRLSAAPPISMDFCTIPTIGSDMFFGGLVVVFDFNWGLGGARICIPHVNKTNDKANLKSS